MAPALYWSYLWLRPVDQSSMNYADTFAFKNGRQTTGKFENTFLMSSVDCKGTVFKFGFIFILGQVKSFAIFC